MSLTKENIIQGCFDYVSDKLAVLFAAIKDAEDSIKEDTKSSAGDKYETSREMIQQDLNRYQQQLKIVQEDRLTLERIAEETAIKKQVGVGSLVKTDNGLYFVSISIGILKVDIDSVFVISSKSPIGASLLGKKVGETFSFQNKTIRILELV